MLLSRRTLPLAAGLLLSLSCLHLSAQSEAETGAESGASRREVMVGDQRVEHLWLGQERLLFGADGSGRWRHFMHGLSDEAAQPLSWEPLLSRDQRKLLSDVRVRTLVKHSDLYSLCLPGGTTVTPERPLLSLPELAPNVGSWLRVFVWLSGEGTGEGGPLWESAPRMSLVLRDGSGAVAARADGVFRTRGTFPWFCYHVELQIPMGLSTVETGPGGGLFVELANPTSGSAWFCTPSYSFLGSAEAQALLGPLPSDWADPRLGTFAPNPDYDELPMHFLLGLPQRRGLAWNFMNGNAQFETLAFRRNLDRYLDRAKDDWLHWTHAIPSLLYMHNVARPLGLTIDFEPRWDELLAERLAAAQDPRTGLWPAAGRGNLMVTYLVASQCFAPTSLAHPGEDTVETDWQAVGKRALPRAVELAKSLLAAQRRDGGTLAGWNKYAFQGDDLIAASRDNVAFDLRCSAAAAHLLALCRPQLPPDLAAQAEQALAAAYAYAAANVMNQTTWLWHADERQQGLLLSPLAYTFLEASRALDARFSASPAALPGASFTLKDARLRIQAARLPEKTVALRVYELLPDQRPETLRDIQLLAIVQRPNPAPATSDPLCLLRQFAAAQANDALRGSFSVREAGSLYCEGKLAVLRHVTTPQLNEQGNATIAIPARAQGRQLAVLAVDRTGTLSLVTIVK